MQEGLEEQALAMVLQPTRDFSSRVPESYAIRKALQMLQDQGLSELPPIQLFSKKPFNMGGGRMRQTDAYVQAPERSTVFVNDQGEAYQGALKNDAEALRQLAAKLAHEAHHVKNGRDEAQAYDEQLRVLGLLGGKTKKVSEARRFVTGQ